MCVQNFLSPGELDPLNRRQIQEDKPDVVVQGMEGFVLVLQEQEQELYCFVKVNIYFDDTLACN